MTRIDALKELKAKVEAGEFPRLWQNVTNALGLHPDDRHIEAHRAHEGSIDAALRLHEAVLPGWQYTVYPDSVEVTKTRREGDCEFINRHDGDADTPARAWLLAVLSALIAQEEQA
jgi:hypothetical protein